MPSTRKKTLYLILEDLTGLGTTWTVRGTAYGHTSEDARKRFLSDTKSGGFVAVPVSSWKPAVAVSKTTTTWTPLQIEIPGAGTPGYVESVV